MVGDLARSQSRRPRAAEASSDERRKWRSPACAADDRTRMGFAHSAAIYEMCVR